jgi:hypothetical protein
MIDLTLTVPGKPGEILYLYTRVEKANFLSVVDMEFATIDEVYQAEKDGLLHIETVK